MLQYFQQIFSEEAISMPNHATTRPANPGRLDAIDVAKGIGILFVVFAHVNYTPELLVLIYSFHMPLFFVLSGMLFRKDRYPNFRTFLTRRFWTLIVPYLLFSILSLVWRYGSEQQFPELFPTSCAEYIGYFTQIFLAQGSHPVLNTPLWFVPCLFAVEILYFWISKLDLRAGIPLCLLLVGLGWLLESGHLNFDNTLLPWSLDSALFALGFYAFGNLARIQPTIHLLRDHRQKTRFCLGILLLCLLIWYPYTLMNGKVTLGSKILNNGFLFYITGISGTLAILSASVLLEKSRFLRFCGRNSFYIMASHYMIRTYTLRKAYTALGKDWYDRQVLAETIVPFLIIFTLSVGFAFLCQTVTAQIRRRCSAA